MHPVIEYLKSRRNCIVPQNDGRKIALVHYGGILSGVNGTGAFTALSDLGYRNAFDEIYTFSAGFPNAAYFLANQARLSTTVYVDDLSGRNFVNWFKPWRIANVSGLIDILQHKKRLDVDRVLQSRTQLYVWLKNCTSNELEFVPARPAVSEDFFKLLKAAVTMEYLSPGRIEYQGSKYKDAGIHRKYFLSAVTRYSSATHFLVLYNRANQHVENTLSKDTIFEIFPNSKISRFESRRANLYAAARGTEEQIKKIFS